MENCGLTSLPPLPPNLEYLSVAANKLRTISGDLPITLEALNVCENFLTSLPDVLSQLPLQTFNCADNRKIRMLPEFTSLRKLDCSNNNLTRIPRSMTRLRSLICSKNRIRSIPDTMPLLRVLDVSDNRLTRLPEIMPNLIFLDVTGNPVFQVPKMHQDWEFLGISETNVSILPLSFLFVTPGAPRHIQAVDTPWLFVPRSIRPLDNIPTTANPRNIPYALMATKIQRQFRVWVLSQQITQSFLGVMAHMPPGIMRIIAQYVGFRNKFQVHKPRKRKRVATY